MGVAFAVKAIEIRNVTYTYPFIEKPALIDANLEIDYGEFVGVCGLTGSGKSTLIRMLNGLIPHYFGGNFQGDVYVCGMNTREHKIGELASFIGLVFQDPDSQIFAGTVEDEVSFGPENLGLPREEIIDRVEEALERTGLASRRLKSPNDFSCGERQLIAIASILAMRPKILVFDEPTSQLDSINSERVLNFIAQLHDEGSTIILVTHELSILAERATRLIVVSDGRIRADDTPKRILSDENLMDEVKMLPPQVTKLFWDLKSRGYKLEDVPVTLDHACEMLERRLRWKATL